MLFRAVGPRRRLLSLSAWRRRRSERAPGEAAESRAGRRSQVSLALVETKPSIQCRFNTQRSCSTMGPRAPRDPRLLNRFNSSHPCELGDILALNPSPGLTCHPTSISFSQQREQQRLSGQKRHFSAQYYNFFRQNWARVTLYNDISYKGHGWPLMWVITATKPAWQPHLEEDYQTIARDEFGIPMQVPPEISTKIKHIYYVPPQYYPFLKKLGDDTPALMPHVEKLINRQFTREDYEEMFYSFARPMKVHRRHIPLPYRSVSEMQKTAEVNWEGAWFSYRQRVNGEYGTHQVAKDWVISMLFASYLSYTWIEQTRYYRVSMKLYYLDAPEHKINWVKPRGDL